MSFIVSEHRCADRPDRTSRCVSSHEYHHGLEPFNQNISGRNGVSEGERRILTLVGREGVIETRMYAGDVPWLSPPNRVAASNRVSDQESGRSVMEIPSTTIIFASVDACRISFSSAYSAEDHQRLAA
jgi:hypothetical protein